MASQSSAAIQWPDALRVHPMFAHLSEGRCGDNGKITLCQSRGDLFVWDPKYHVILTTNLKKVQANLTASEGRIGDEDFANEDQLDRFQLLHPTAFPATLPSSLNPSPSGRYLALVGTEYVYVMELWRQRGPHGEFSGGMHEVDCRTLTVGDTLIRAHRLIVLQMEWHPDDSGLIGVLSNDGALRLFHLSNPLVPQITLPVSDPHPTYSRALCLDKGGVVVSFSFISNSILLLQDHLDIQTIQIKEGEQPSAPLPMYPLDKDNYSDTACSLLVILSHPPVIVMATTTGRLLHSVFLEPEGSESDEDMADFDGNVTVIESLSLGFEESDIKLVADPSLKHLYCVCTSADIYCIEMPWLINLEQFGFDGIQFSANPPSIDKHLLRSPDCSICDCVIVMDSILGACLLVTVRDGNCLSIPLELDTASAVRNPLTKGVADAPAGDIPTTNAFVTHIDDLLRIPKEKHPLPKRLPDSQKAEISQEQCFKFLQESLILLRQRCIAPQQTAATKLEGRRRERQLNDLLSLEEGCDNTRENGERLDEKLDRIRRTNDNQTMRIEKMLATITTSSPVLSDAEKALAKDLILIQEQLDSLAASLTKANRKVSLGLAQPGHSQLSLNSEKLETILTSLSDDGTAIKNSVRIIKDLAVSLNLDDDMSK